MQIEENFPQATAPKGKLADITEIFCYTRITPLIVLFSHPDYDRRHRNLTDSTSRNH